MGERGREREREREGKGEGRKRERGNLNSLEITLCELFMVWVARSRKEN